MSGAELPEDVLPTILAALEVPDLLRAGGVCSSWRRACASLRHAHARGLGLGASIRPQTPCLLYTSARAGASAAGLYSLAEARPYTLALPDPSPPIRDCYLIGSAHGWLVTVDRRSELRLLNPVTGDQVDLPSVATVEQVTPLRDWHGVVRLYEYSWHSGFHTQRSKPSVFRLHKLREYAFQKVFLSSDPSAGAYTVVLIHNPCGQLSFARAGDESWTWLPFHTHYSDCLFKDDLLYAVQVGGAIHAYDLSDHALKPRVVMDGCRVVGPNRMYIVQAPCGDLLQIHKDFEYSDEEAEAEDVPGDQPGFYPPAEVDEDFSESERARSEDDASSDYSDEEAGNLPGGKPGFDPSDDDEYFSERERATSEVPGSGSEDDANSELDYLLRLREKVVFKVFRVDLTAKKFVEISSLGDNVLFLGLNQSLCLWAKEYPDLKGNHVYFTDDAECMAWAKNKKRDMGVFDLDNQISEKIVSPRIWSNWPAPIWIVPNPRKMNPALLS